MAISSAQNHFRSISLPSRLHPNAIKLEAELRKLKIGEFSRKSECITPEVIQSGFLGLAELYSCVEELMLSQSTQQSLVQLQHADAKIVEESLENSVELLDSCGTIRELVVMIKEQFQDLQSALRRKGHDSSIQNDMNKYFSFRKKMNKSIAKSLKKLKHMESKNGATFTDNHNPSMAIWMLREATNYAISIFRSLLVFLSSPAASMGGWSLVSKLKSVASHRNDDILSEVGSVDFALNSLNAAIRSGSSKAVDVQMASKKLRNLDARIEGFEAELERLFRQLLQSRVTLLNIITDS